ncbi:MAG: hypothetical protein WEE89_10795 [Gemmatimonadota bacterium]
MNIESYSAELLRRSAGRMLSLKRLHETLKRELGPGAGTYHQLQQRLNQARHAFIILERPNPLADEASWPETVRAEYALALDRAGLDLSPVVSLVSSADEQPGLVGELGRTLSHLCECVRLEPALQAELIEALADLPALEQAITPARQTTTPPPDLPER